MKTVYAYVVASYGGQVIVLPYNKEQSSTKIKEKW